MRVLHLLSQRPSLTGSGVTLDAVVRCAAETGWEQQVVIGVPLDDGSPTVGGLDQPRIHPLRFGGDDIPFPVPGMSDVMPYPSTVFGTMTDPQISTYLDRWRRHIAEVVAGFKPHIIHSHHIWLMSSLLKDLAPTTPVVTHCHATGLRQMRLVPDLATGVRVGCARNDGFFVLHRQHAHDLAKELAIPADRIHVIGAGYREDLFSQTQMIHDRSPALLYIGKYSSAKGLPSLLDAFERLSSKHPVLSLHIAGDGSGPEADALRRRMVGMSPGVVLHGQLPQTALSALMRRSTICVLPSFYEGLPLVLVEALACGCRLVATDLPGVAKELAPRIGTALDLVELPSMAGIDTPVESELSAFVARLEAGIERAINAPPLPEQTDILKTFTWPAVFDRIERVWRQLINAP